MKRFLPVLLCLSVMSLWWGCGGGKSGSEVPTGARLFITPADDIKVESSSSVLEEASQLFAVAARDAVAGPSTGTPAGGASAAAVEPTGRGVRDVGFSITFEFSNPPDRQVLPDAASAVTLCDGTRIVNTRVQKVTDSSGNYSLCVSYKTGGGLAYTGRLFVSSGDQSPFVNFDISSKPQTLAVSPLSQTVPAGSLAQFTIVGGIPPYAIAGSPALLPPVPAVVTSIGGSFNVTAPLSTPEGTGATYTITDATGAQVSVSLTIGKPPSQPQVFPESTDVLPGGKSQFVIVNGYPPYTIVSSNPLVPPVPATVALSGGIFTATVPLTTQEITKVTFTVRDTVGLTDTATVNVAAPQNLIITPSQVAAIAGDSILFSIIGGIPSYVVTTSDGAVVASPSTITSSGGTFRVRIPGDSTNKTVTVTATDIRGKQASATIKVTEAPQLLRVAQNPTEISGAIGGNVFLTITGGTPPYLITSSDSTNAYFGTPLIGSMTASASGTVTATVPVGAPAKTVTFIVVDQEGTRFTTHLTIVP